MDHARWERIQELFHGTADLPQTDQKNFLRAHCGDDDELMTTVLVMLQEDAAGTSLLDHDMAGVAHQLLAAAPADSNLPVRQFGPYLTLGVLGEGGMGIVYLARRSDLGHLVAIKVLRDAWLSPARHERFLSEQRTLAQLNHPFIAQLYDADTLADGTPWFVMEYVPGTPLTDYCARHAPSVEQRLMLFRLVCEAVHHAHLHSIVHRDLKPSNILVKPDGTVKLVDFGIAKQLDDRAAERTKTGLRFLTPAYAAPEQLRGGGTSIQTDVYSLGVILYELLTGRLPSDVSGEGAKEAAITVTTAVPVKPSVLARQRGTRTASWSDLDVLCLTAMHRDAVRRYDSVGALVRDLDHYLAREPLEARPDGVSYRLGKFARRNWRALSTAAAMLALMTVASVLALSLYSRTAPPESRGKTVAVLPFENTGADREIDFLGLAIPDEIARMLNYVHSLSVRPFEATRKYAGPHRDLQKAGREQRAATVVTGDFSRTRDRLQITLEAIDVRSNRTFWRDAFVVSSKDTIELEVRVAGKIRQGLAPLLGASESAETTRPRNEKAYELYLRSASYWANPEGVKQAIATLEKSVALDSGYAPAWAALASKYRSDGWYGDGGSVMLDRAESAAERALSLDPDNLVAARGLIENRAGRGDLIGAYQEAAELVRRRPDHAHAHFSLGYVLRYAGLLDEAARECDAVFLIDPQDGGIRSCGIPFMLRGNYQRAEEFFDLDGQSDWFRGFSLDNLVRGNKMKEAQSATPGGVPHWSAYEVFADFLKHRPLQELAGLARAVKAESDSELNYIAAGHLSYAGQTYRAIEMLKLAIEGGYCSYPAIDSDPLLANVRAQPEFAQIRSAAIACQNNFLAQRRRLRDRRPAALLPFELTQ